MRKLPKLVYVRLAGGLGNQLFQLAAGLICAQAVGRTLVPVVDSLGQYDRPQEATSLRLVSSGVMQPSADPTPAIAWAVARGRIGRWLPWIGMNDSNFFVIANTLRPSHLLFYVLDGYFQHGWTPGLFAHATSMMNVSEDLMPHQTVYDCIVHVRGTDFLNFQSHGFLQPDYYVNAVAEAVKGNLRHFGIVTDDQEYGALIAHHIRRAHQNIVVDVLPETGQALADFHRIRTARARIMGNSTFAWWAAALDVNSAKTWSCSQFVRNQVRNFFLPCEIPLGPNGKPGVNEK